MRIAGDLADRQLVHVIPILDAGQDAESGSYFVVMPRAQKSLQDELTAGKTWDSADAAKILLEISRGLAEIPDIAHRDLKPGNVLYHEGKWKVADFGIACFVEESTSLRTLRGFLSPPYAAPEQWRGERSTSATDVYALGCIAFALVEGRPPFVGPTREEFHDQHLHQEPPRLADQCPQLRSLVLVMLRKNPQARPSLERVKQVLSNVIQGPTPSSANKGLAALARAGSIAAERESAEDAKHQRKKSREEARERLACEAYSILSGIIDRMFENILGLAPAANPTPIPDEQVLRGFRIRLPRHLQLGDARLIVEAPDPPMPLPSEAFSESGWDVVARASVGVEQACPPYKWGASLWYACIAPDDRHRWWEVAYFVNPHGLGGTRDQPFALTNLNDADRAARRSDSLDRYKIAFGPKPVDDEDAQGFFDRWAGLLAKAHNQQLRRPRRLPLE